MPVTSTSPEYRRATPVDGANASSTFAVRSMKLLAPGGRSITWLRAPGLGAGWPLPYTESAPACRRPVYSKMAFSTRAPDGRTSGAVLESKIDGSLRTTLTHVTGRLLLLLSAPEAVPARAFAQRGSASKQVTKVLPVIVMSPWVAELKTGR